MLAISYILLSVIMTILILSGIWYSLVKFYDTKQAAKRPFIKSVAVLLGWHIYLVLISQTDLIKDISLPPKLPILIFGPIILMVVIAWTKYKNDPRLDALPQSWPIYYQTFRIAVETMIHFTFIAAILPKSASFNGYNFDIMMGILAPFVAYFLVKNNKQKPLVKYWNMLGIIMVLFVAFIVASSIYNPSIWGSETILVDLKFVEMPYLLLAGFLAPSAIIIHIISLMQGRKSKLT